eukprot:GFYU01003801.1.p1 GENE.GFYU01003801.1~~GFYU01003801.1.p1  ORF type:complete len:498 (-),score=15.65 GFYU01003801.1:709-2202(-)
MEEVPPAVWTIFGVVILVLLVFSGLVVRHYADLHEDMLMPRVVTVLSLTSSLLGILVVPLDIYNVSNVVPNIDERNEEIKLMYYIMYGVILLFAFFVIPLSYFYYEEEDEEISVCERVTTALKYTLGFLLSVAILVVIGVFLKPERKGDREEWIKRLVSDQGKGDSSITFTVACVATLGIIGWIFYTGYGLSSFPVSLMKGKRGQGWDERVDISADLARVRERIRAIQSKYSRTGQKMSRRDKAELDRMRQIERTLNLRNARANSSSGAWSKIGAMLQPFKFVGGAMSFVLSLFLVVSLMLTTVDKAINSRCGARCGFAIESPQIFNPFDQLLLQMSEVFPVDYLILTAVVLFLFVGTMAGILRMGVRFGWILLYKIKPRATPPQALLLMAFLLTFIILQIGMSVLTMAPQYATFGNQMIPGTQHRCTLASTECNMSQIATFYNRIGVNMSFFGVLFYYSNWVFLGMFFVWTLVALFSSRRRSGGTSNFSSSDSDGV